MKVNQRFHYDVILLLLPIFLCFSCIPGKVSNSVLLHADSLMECCADSALILLQKIKHPQEMSKAEWAFYALLRTKADDKNFIDHTSDSLIKQAAAYYQRYGNTLQKMEVLYYQASVYRDLGDAPRAIDYFQQAVKLSPKQTEHQMLCRIYSQMGTLYFYQKLPEEGMNAYRKFHKHALLANDSLKLANSCVSMARVYTELNNIDSTLYYYKEAEILARKIENKWLEENIQSELTDIYLQLNEPEKARELLINSTKSGVDYLNWGDLYKKSGKPDSAKYAYLKALEIGNRYIKQRANWELYQLSKSRGQEKETICYLEQYTTYKDSIQKITDTEGVKRVQSLYAYQHIENENNRLLLENKRNENIIYLGLLLSLTMIGILYLKWRKMKDQKDQISRLNHAKKQEYQEKVAAYNKEIDLLKEQSNQISIQNSHGKELLQEKINKALEELDKTVTLRQEAETAFRSSNIYQQVYNAKHKMTNEHWLELQKEIDKTFNDFTARLYQLYPELKQRELYVSFW